MKHLITLLVCASVAALVAAAISCTSDLLWDSRGRGLAQWYLSEIRRRDALNQRSVVIAHSLEVKRAVIGDLLAHHLTVREAARQFAEADALIEDDDDVLVAPYRKPRTEAQRYHQVINWVKNQVGDRSVESKRILRQLKQEIRRPATSASRARG